jgi:hypothetical protein
MSTPTLLSSAPIASAPIANTSITISIMTVSVSHFWFMWSMIMPTVITVIMSTTCWRRSCMIATTIVVICSWIWFCQTLPNWYEKRTATKSNTDTNQ